MQIKEVTFSHISNILMQLIHLFSISSGNVTGQIIPPPPTCPGDTFTFSCTVTGDVSGTTIWRVNASSNWCSLAHLSTGNSSCCPIGGNYIFTARTGTGFGPGTTATSFSSILSGTATPALNGTLVECYGPASNEDPGNMVGNSTILIRGK